MPSPYPVELRERAVASYEAGEGSYVEVSERFRVCRRALQHWVKRKRATGSAGPKPRGGGTHSPMNMELFEALVDEHPDASTYELTAEYNHRVGRQQRTHRSSIRRALSRAGFAFKKKGLGRPSWIVQKSN